MSASVTKTSPVLKVTAEEVLHIAALSNLHLTVDEAVTMQRDLNAILNYVAELNELNTTAVTPMAQVGEMLAMTSHLDEEDSRAVLRQDVPVASLGRDRVMGQAPESDGIFFKVPKVIER